MDHCIRILLDNLCKIGVSGSLCEDPLDHLYQDPAGALVQAPFDYLYLSVQDFLWTTCIILEEHLRKISISGSFSTTSTRIL